MRWRSATVPSARSDVYKNDGWAFWLINVVGDVDVGVGKTYTALGILARARQEGWVRRPVILVPNSNAYLVRALVHLLTELLELFVGLAHEEKLVGRNFAQQKHCVAGNTGPEGGQQDAKLHGE